MTSLRAIVASSAHSVHLTQSQGAPEGVPVINRLQQGAGRQGVPYQVCVIPSFSTSSARRNAGSGGAEHTTASTSGTR